MYEIKQYIRNKTSSGRNMRWTMDIIIIIIIRR